MATTTNDTDDFVPANAAQARALRRLRGLAGLLDDRFRVPGTNIRYGLDGLIGFVPGIGDTAMSLVSAYILIECYRLGVPKPVLARMLTNLGLDWLIGLIPIVGDLFDVGFKANRRNFRLAEQALAELDRRDPKAAARVKMKDVTPKRR